MITTCLVVLLLLIAIASLLVFGLTICVAPTLAVVAFAIALPDLLTIGLIAAHISRKNKKKKAIKEYEEWKAKKDSGTL